MWHSDMMPLVLTSPIRPAGHYTALEWSENDQKYIENPNLGILVEVDVSLMTVLSPCFLMCPNSPRTCPALVIGT